MAGNTTGSEWIYSYSKALRMRFKFRKTEAGIEVMTEDRVIYSADEVRELDRIGGITPEIHATKKAFGGTVLGEESQNEN